MTNQKIADIFERIANLLEIKGGNKYKVMAYRRVAESIRQQTANLSIMDIKALKKIPGVGQAIAEKILELSSTGGLAFLSKLENEVPSTLIEILQVQNVGPKKTALFWRQAGITNLQELETAARSGVLRHLPSMGKKSEARILANIKALKQRGKRYPINKAKTIAEKWLEILGKFPLVERVEAAGSLRRWKPTVGDLDLVAASKNPTMVMKFFLNQPGIAHILSQGDHKSSISLKNGLNIQLWIQPPERYGSLLQFATGSKEHNIRIRELAQKHGLSLSERGFIDSSLKEILCKKEIEIYSHLDLSWIPPELREDQGEIQSALEKRLPELIKIRDIIADLHTHVNWSSEKSSFTEIARAAVKRGLHILAITDPSPQLAPNSHLEKQLTALRFKELDDVQAEMGNDLLLLQGIEVHILPDGKLDCSDKVLAKKDVVIASLQYKLDQPRDQITKRLIKAIRNPHVNIIGHPISHTKGRHESTDIDWEKVLTAAQKYNVALEINSNPLHLELDENITRRAIESGVLISINTDAHNAEDLDNLQYGVAIARRGWAEKKHIINAWPKDKILRWLKGKEI